LPLQLERVVALAIQVALLVLFLRIRLSHYSYSWPRVEGQQAAAQRLPIAGAS